MGFFLLQVEKKKKKRGSTLFHAYIYFGGVGSQFKLYHLSGSGTALAQVWSQIFEELAGFILRGVLHEGLPW